MTRNGEDIRTYPLKDAVASGIMNSMQFLEWEAATAAGLNLWLWENNGYTKAFKVKVIAWYNLHGLVQSHQSDAAASKDK